MQRGPTGKVSSLSFHVGGAHSQMLAMLFAFGNTHRANQLARKEPDMTFEDLPLFRSSDPTTSRDGAKHVMIRRTGQLARLLMCYADSQIGMTDEEAEEYIEFNCIGAWIGEQTPIIVKPLAM